MKTVKTTQGVTPKKETRKFPRRPLHERLGLTKEEFERRWAELHEETFARAIQKEKEGIPGEERASFLGLE